MAEEGVCDSKLIRGGILQINGRRQGGLRWGVGEFTYLGRPLEKLYNECLAVFRNIQKARQVWGRLRKIIRMEGVEPFVSAIFYIVVVQAVLIFRSEKCVLLAEMLKRLEGVHVFFLRKIVEKKAWRHWYGTWKR